MRTMAVLLILGAGERKRRDASRESVGGRGILQRRVDHLAGAYGRESCSSPRIAGSTVRRQLPSAPIPPACALRAGKRPIRWTNRCGRSYARRRATPCTGCERRSCKAVFGRTKEVRGFRRFRLRGIKSVRCEFDLIALTHNLLKLFRGPQPI